MDVYNFINDDGVNEIEEWLDSLTMEDRTDFNTKLDYIIAELKLNGQIVNSRIFKKLRGKDCKGLFEIKVNYNNIAYRPIVCFGPARRQLTLLLIMSKKGNRYRPSNFCEIASQRVNQIKTASRIKEHCYE